MKISYRILQPEDAAKYRQLRLERLRLQLGVLCGPRRLRTLGRAHRSSCNAGRRLACSAPRRATRPVRCTKCPGRHCSIMSRRRPAAHAKRPRAAAEMHGTADGG